MVNRLRRFIPAVFIIGAALFVTLQSESVPAHAVTTPSQAITLSPTSTDVAVDPGATASKKLDIINSGSDAFTVKITTSPYYVSGENYDPQFTQLPGTIDASAWVHPSVDTAKVEGMKTLTIPFTIEVPKGTASGGYYAVIFAETSSDNETTGVVSHNRVGDILYITVNGDIKSGGSLTGNPLPSVSFVGSVPLSTKISNTGGTHFITDAIYTVTDLSGNQVFSATTERYVLPQTEREISSTWSPQTLFGVFTVHRSATIAGNTRTLPDEKIIVINPWIFVVIAFIIGLLVAILFNRARRRHSKEK
jgi:hypothetical protein